MDNTPASSLQQKGVPRKRLAGNQLPPIRDQTRHPHDSSSMTSKTRCRQELGQIWNCDGEFEAAFAKPAEMIKEQNNAIELGYARHMRQIFWLHRGVRETEMMGNEWKA